ncbi:hypothetical protein PG987_000263 [Apiospora arundinis]
MSLMEDLPAELRCLVLRNAPNLASLRSLVRSSPVMHAQYREDRNSILRTCLNREMHGYVTDAYATAMSNKEIAGFLDLYKSASPPGIDAISSEGLYWLATFHTTVAIPLFKLYPRWALANLKKASSLSKEDKPMSKAASKQIEREEAISLSRSEEIRVMQAIYRHETYNHLFGQAEDQRDGSFTNYDIHGVFFCKFEPWESEAIGCIDVFLRDQYKGIFDKVKGSDAADFDEDQHRIVLAKPGAINPGFSGLNPAGFAKMAENLATLHYIDRIIARGLKSSVWLLQLDEETKFDFNMQQHLEHLGRDVGTKDDPMRLALGTNAQQFRRMVRSADPRDEAEVRRDSIAFLGDDINGDDDEDDAVLAADGVEATGRPPVAWVLLWKGKYSHLYGDYVPSPLRQWGYVMWDEQRWNDLEATDLVAKQWESSPEFAERIWRMYHWSPLED